jgi:adenylate kinase
MFRESIRRGTPVGLRAKAIMERGDLVPDDVVVAMVEQRITQPDCARGFILDGFPRTVAQAEALKAILRRIGLAKPLVVCLQLDSALIVRRITGRRVCKVGGEIYNIYDSPPKTPGRCDRDGGELMQRDDDREEVIRERLLAYQEYTQPVLEFYRRGNLVVDVDGSGSPETVAQALVETLEQSEDRGC